MIAAIWNHPEGPAQGVRPSMPLSPLRSDPMARLSVNLNKVALLRNSRRTGVPDVLALRPHRAGRRRRGPDRASAPGRAAHPPRSDVPALAALMQPCGRAWNSISRATRTRACTRSWEAKPEQCTLVPDSPDAFTSEEGWKLEPRRCALARPHRGGEGAGLPRHPVHRSRSGGRDAGARSGADGVEIYTGGYARRSVRRHQCRPADMRETARRAARHLGWW